MSELTASAWEWIRWAMAYTENVKGWEAVLVGFIMIVAGWCIHLLLENALDAVIRIGNFLSEIRKSLSHCPK